MTTWIKNIREPSSLTSLLASMNRMAASISWTFQMLPSKNLLVLKTPSTRLQRNNFTSSKTSWRHVLKMSWRHVFKMSWRHALKTSWRHYGDKQYIYWGYLYLTNLNVHLTNIYFTNLYLTILRRIQNALIRTQ